MLHGALNSTMDTKILLLMVAACVCGSYRNSSTLPEPYQGHLKTPVEKEKNERAYHFGHTYEEIITGKRDSMCSITFFKCRVCWLFKQTKNMYFPPFSKSTDSASATLADAPQPDPGWCNEGIQDCNGPHTKQHCKKLCESQPGKRLTKMLYHI